ncbi:MAG: 30S ribosomal protein S17 [Deltaproteobacteria bacterium RIFCSPHIGHO2_02_FULL_40_11]|nr:MAG: 30S ribosomal protein S17 [Deltaproteobacteria bacterium RIFCSPHIGHO2_02_FULL_40_11]
MVVRSSQPKTLIVETTHREQHPVYKKYIQRKKKYYVHDEKQQAKNGDKIRFEESKPFSKLKRWNIKEILKA